MKIILVMLILISMNQAHALDFLNPFLRFIKPNGPLIGEDIDKNGIRDDVEVAINKRFKDKNKRSIYLLFAHHYESVLKYGTNEKHAKDWWINNEKLYICIISLIHYGHGEKLIPVFDDREWVMQLVYNRTKRWDANTDWNNATYHYGNRYKINLDVFEEIVMMKEYCAFNISDYEKHLESALKRIFLVDGKVSQRLRGIKNFEKKHGTKYRDRYEKYYKNSIVQ